MNFGEIPPKTPKIWFWEVRGRKWAPGPLKYLWITAVFTRQRKGTFACEFRNFLWNHDFQYILWQITKFQEITLKFGKSAFCRNPRPFTKHLFFLGQMDGPEPWDHQNLEITRIPLNLVKFHYFNEIMLNFGDFSRFLVKIILATWRVPGGPMLKTMIFL